MDQHPERLSDPVTEESIFQLPHLPLEHREDCQRGHCCAGIPTQPIICRSTSLRAAKYFSYQANTYQTGSGSFSYKFENKVPAPFPNPTASLTASQTWLSRSRRVQYAESTQCNENPDAGLDSGETVRPVPPHSLFSFLAIIDMQDLYFTGHNTFFWRYLTTDI